MSPEEKTTVFVVDDDEDFLLQQKVQLEGAGFAVVTAESESRARAMLEEGLRADIAVIDLMMENADAGFTLCRRIKRALAIPVVIVTAVTSETGIEFDATTEEERSWVQADALLAKPVRFEELRQEIDRLLKA